MVYGKLKNAGVYCFFIEEAILKSKSVLIFLLILIVFLIIALIISCEIPSNDNFLISAADLNSNNLTLL